MKQASYTKTEAARLIGVTRQTVHMWIKSGAIKTVDIGEGWGRIPQSEIDRHKGLKNINNEGLNSAGDYFNLTDEKRNVLWDWCYFNFYKRKTVNKRYTSYGLKHIFERSKNGFYITNGQFKGAMLASGQMTRNELDLNWCFCISEKSPALKWWDQ